MAETVEIEVRVKGIPAIVAVTVNKAELGRRDGYGLQLEPDWPAEMEIEGIKDRKGYKAEWLERKLITGEDWEVLEEDIWKVLRDIEEARMDDQWEV